MNPLVANVTASGRQEVYTRGVQYIYIFNQSAATVLIRKADRGHKQVISCKHSETITLIYRPNGRRRLGRPMNRLSDEPKQVYQGSDVQVTVHHDKVL